MLNFGLKKKLKMLKENLIKLKSLMSLKELKVLKNSKPENNDCIALFRS
jgi:hypothetical protein